MRRVHRAIATVIAASTLATAAAAVAPAAGADAPKWKIGDCYATADVDADTVELTSKVDCAQEHAVQVLAGAPLPKALATTGLANLLDSDTSERGRLLSFVRDTCTPAAMAKHVYPKSAKRLASLFERYDVDEWMAPAAGSTGWVLPDADGFAAGATDLLCVHIPNAAVHGTTAGDLRRISTRDPLPSLRLCADFRADGRGAVGVSCADDHEIESLIWLALDTTDAPPDVSSWTADDWKPYDTACRDFAVAVIGAKRTDIVVTADTRPDEAPLQGTRFFNCRAYSQNETAAFPGGVILTGAGSAPIRFTTT